MISYEDALRNADSENDLRLQIKLNSKKNGTAGEDGSLDGLSLMDYEKPDEGEEAAK